MLRKIAAVGIIFLCILSLPGSGLCQKNRFLILGDEALLLGNHKGAIICYQQYMQRAPIREQQKLWDDLGFAYLRIGEIKKAISFLKLAARTFPENFNLHLYLAAAYVLSGRTDQAQEHLDRIRARIFFDKSWRERIASKLILNRYPDEIPAHELEWLENEKGIYIEEIKPDYTGMRLLKFRAGNRVRLKALGRDQTWVVIRRDCFDARNEGCTYFLQGCIREHKKQYQRSESDYFAALDAGYDERIVRTHLHGLFGQSGENEKAEEQARILEKLESPAKAPQDKDMSDHIVIHHRIRGHDSGLLEKLHTRFLDEIKQGHLDDAIDTLENALLVDEKNPVVNQNLALLYYDKAKLYGGAPDCLRKAEAACQRSLWYKHEYDDEHDISRFYELLGNIFTLQGRNEEAIREFERILEKDYQDASAHYNLGCTYYAMNDRRSAEREWLLAQESVKMSGPTQNETGIPQDEKKIFLTVRREPVGFLIHQALGNLYLEEKNAGPAIAQLELAVKAKPAAADPYLSLAKALTLKAEPARDEIAKAIEYLEKYLFLGGESEEARQLLKTCKQKRK